MAQVEVSRTWCSPSRYARGFFEALVADNLDLGRPDTIEIVFDRQIRGGQRHWRRVQDRNHPRTEYRERLLQALPDQVPERRPRPADRDRNQRLNDLGCQRRLHNLDDLQAKARAVNARCCRPNVSARAVSRIQSSSGSRTPPSPRRGGELQPCVSATRVQALAGALCAAGVTGITNRSRAP